MCFRNANISIQETDSLTALPDLGKLQILTAVNTKLLVTLVHKCNFPGSAARIINQTQHSTYCYPQSSSMQMPNKVLLSIATDLSLFGIAWLKVQRRLSWYSKVQAGKTCHTCLKGCRIKLKPFVYNWRGGNIAWTSVTIFKRFYESYSDVGSGFETQKMPVTSHKDRKQLILIAIK